MVLPGREPPASTAQRIGDRYTVEAVLGQGGMGAVYRVRDGARDRMLALKQLAVTAQTGAGNQTPTGGSISARTP